MQRGFVVSFTIRGRLRLVAFLPERSSTPMTMALPVPPVPLMARLALVLVQVAGDAADMIFASTYWSAISLALN